MGRIICLVCALIVFSVVGVAGASLNENATDEEILSYARGVIDAGYIQMIPSIDDRVFYIDQYLCKSDRQPSHGDITFWLWMEACITDKVCSKYPGRFDYTIVFVHSYNEERGFWGSTLNRAT